MAERKMARKSTLINLCLSIYESPIEGRVKHTTDATLDGKIKGSSDWLYEVCDISFHNETLPCTADKQCIQTVTGDNDNKAAGLDN